MKLLFGNEYHLWQTIRAEVARLTAELEGAEHTNQLHEETIRVLREDVKYHREKSDRAVDNILLTKGLPSILPEPPTPLDVFDESDEDVEAMRKSLQTDPAKAWHS